MSKKLYEEVKELFESKGYTLISTEYKNARAPLEYICPFHKELGVQTISYFSVQQGKGCRACGYERVSKKLKETKRIYNYSDVVNLFNEKLPECQLLTKEEEFEGTNTVIKFICPRHSDIIQHKTFYSLMQKPWCGSCQTENAKIKRKEKKKYSFQDAVEFAKNTRYKLNSTEKDYINCRSKLTWICDKHGPFESNLYAMIVEGKGCRKCGYEENGIKSRKNFEDVKADIRKEGYIVLSPPEDYTGYDCKLKLKCPKHPDLIFYNSYSHIVKSHIRCPKCSESKGERKIRLILEENNISYEYQKRYKDLYRYNQKYLSYDFYIPALNLLIEYQGEYHDTITNFSTKEALKDQQQRDKLKRDYAKNHNIELLEIWHQDFDKVEEILKERGVIQ